ncbi:RNA-binding protein 34 [Ambystoma mexicanum]|uniref:RNA-binding protein 34 n=1 Tax=Ambystoma mexicanum TaxID=8296 RepID=UPI0037E88426
MEQEEGAGEVDKVRPRRIKKSKKHKGSEQASPGPEYAVGLVASSLRGSAKGSLSSLASLFGTGEATVLAPIYAPAPPAIKRGQAPAATTGGRPAQEVRPPAVKKYKPLPASELLVSEREGPLQEADLQEEQREQHVREKRKERRLQGIEDQGDETPGPTRPPRPVNKAEERLKDKRTVFVGNLPVSFTKQALRALFKGFGTIESVRFRSVARAEPSLNRKVAAIQRQVHPKRKTLHAYVVFKEEVAAGRALANNGAQVEGGFNIRVDRASGGKSHDNRRSAFVGNLPYDAEDQVVRDHFAQCGEVVAVRIIRDRETGVGKGFGYVLFAGIDGAQLAMKLDGSELMGRKVRVKRCVQNDGSPASGPPKFSGSKHKLDPSVKDRKKRPPFKRKLDPSVKDRKKRPPFKRTQKPAGINAENTGRQRLPKKRKQ